MPKESSLQSSSETSKNEVEEPGQTQSTSTQTASDTWEKVVEISLCRRFTLARLRAKAAEANVSLTELKALIDDAWRNSSYVPLSGALETYLGDAIAETSTSRFCLFECKRLPTPKAWKAEALSINGGKNRLALYQQLKDFKNLMKVGRKSHFLVAYDNLAHDIRCMRYWDFIGHVDQHKQPFDDLLDISKVRGVSIEDLKVYLTALVAQQSGNVDGEMLLFMWTVKDRWQAMKTTLPELQHVFGNQLRVELEEVAQSPNEPKEKKVAAKKVKKNG